MPLGLWGGVTWCWVVVCGGLWWFVSLVACGGFARTSVGIGYGGLVCWLWVWLESVWYVMLRFLGELAGFRGFLRVGII